MSKKKNYQICVSGAAAGPSVEQSKDVALELGKAIAKTGATLLTGATVGLPNYAAMGCKQAGGLSVGISPAASKLEHVKKYRLPTENYDVILYTGLHYTGRDTLLVNCSDAVASLGGRLGTLHEFTVAMETETPIGFLNGTGGVTEMIEDLLETAGKQYYQEVSYADSAQELIDTLIKRLDEEHEGHKELHLGEAKDSDQKDRRRG